MTTLKEVLDVLTNDEAIIQRFIEIYPDQKRSVPGYMNVLEKLRSIKPKKTKWFIEVETAYDDFDGIEYVDVSGLKENDDQHYAVEFVEWKEWLGMTVSDKSKHRFNELDILCYCLYEMTFMGFEEKEIQGTLTELEQSVEDFKSEKANEIL